MSYDDLSFDDVEVESLGWAKWPDVGVTYTGEFMALSDDGGKTYDGDVCPELTLLVDDATLRVTLDKGPLKDAVYAAKLSRGDVVRVTRTEDAESKAGREYQTFQVSVARGAARSKVTPEAKGAPAPASAGWD